MDKSQYGRRDRLMQEKRHDTYREDKKWPEPTACTECDSVYLEGRWTWYEPPYKANRVLCPACQRIAENYPAGYLELKGAFFKQHREEMLNLINNEEKQEKADHPLERVMAIDEEEEELVLITTTGIHIARRIGEAISRAYQGDLSFTYGDGEKTIRIFWNR
ncbi:MAG: ATPase [Proteobacteria bacterium]|nr:ATPase [Pseudomonadota bacterium]MBU1419891.1 ATPase [Pseudomonadota bacterium]MBU1454015.1 ATPase [Pseudomonadota bacterium]